MLGCTTIPDIGTRVYVYDRLKSVQINNTPEQVIYLMDGQPSYVTSLREGVDVFDVWEYRVGNFLYDRPVVILFRNNRVLALPKSSQELINALYSYGVIRDAQFWDQKNR